MSSLDHGIQRSNDLLSEALKSTLKIDGQDVRWPVATPTLKSLQLLFNITDLAPLQHKQILVLFLPASTVTTRRCNDKPTTPILLHHNDVQQFTYGQ
jgi:hypothetical protein